MQESLTMNTVLEEAIEHLKEQQKNSTQLMVCLAVSSHVF